MSNIQSAQIGDFTDPATWVGGIVPDPAADIITVNAGHLVRAHGLAWTDIDPARWTINGTLVLTAGEIIGGASGPATAALDVLERLALNIVATCQTISTTAGYKNTVADVVRPNPGIGNETQDKRLVVLQGDAVREAECPEMYTQWLQDFMVLCMVQESEGSATSVDTRLNSLAADVEYALCFSRASQVRGGLAEDTILDARTYAPSDVAAHDGVVLVNVSVRYRTAYNNPLRSIYDP
jgi:hypothetical protein